jgi:hypothetical protein
MTVQTKQVDIPNFEFQEVSLINTTTGVIFRVYPRDTDEPYIFNQIIIDEDMFSEAVTGTLLFNDPAFLIDQLSFTSFDIVQIQFKSLKSIDANYAKTLTFRITEVVSNANAIAKNTMGPAGAAIPIAIKFASNEILYKNFNSSLVETFIGKISSGANENSPPSSTILKEEIPFIEAPTAITTRLPGFIEYIFENFGKDPQNPAQQYKKLKSDETFNGLWLKVNPSYYPWNKIGASLKISQLMNYVCEYACYQKNPNAVNYFFWEDLDKFNFRCVESLLEEANGTPVATYRPTLNEMDEDGMVVLSTVVETPVATLISNGAFSGEYVRVKPNWDNPYRAIIDTADALQKFQITYDYYGSLTQFKKIAPYPPLDENQNIDMSLAYAPNRISDSNYGYFQGAYSQKQTPWWNYWDGDYKGYAGVGGSSTDTDRIEDNYWQAQFDFCELPTMPLKIIYENIKKPLDPARKAYAGLKRLKTKWDFFYNTILGVRNMPSSFFAIITSARKIYDNGAGGIYEYTFEEVEFWRKSQTEVINLETRHRVWVNEDPNYPFYIVGVPWGIKGTRAYNLNEMLNTAAPIELDGQEYQTAFLGPGISAKVKKGSTPVQEGTSYPKEYRMMPVGRFILKSTDPVDRTNMVDAGRIVEMKVVSSRMVDVLASKAQGDIQVGLITSLPENAYMYVFDVVNAHDGVCS